MFLSADSAKDSPLVSSLTTSFFCMASLMENEVARAGPAAVVGAAAVLVCCGLGAPLVVVWGATDPPFLKDCVDGRKMSMGSQFSSQSSTQLFFFFIRQLAKSDKG